MIAALSRAVMALSVHVLGIERRDWARAMQAEFDAAEEDGKALGFAMGCLVAACRQLPAHEGGRFAIANHALALIVIVPVAALTVFSTLAGFPASYLGQPPLLTDANLSAVPSLFVLVLVIAALNLRFAWLALDRDWPRLIPLGAVSAAATATLVIFSAVVFADPAAAVTQVAAVTIQLAAAAVLARWHSRLAAGSEAPVHPV